MRASLDRRLAWLFVCASAGVLLVVGLALAQVGPFAVAAYLLLVLAGLVMVGRRARTLRRASAEPAGRTCSCCDSTVHDPVQVI